MAENSRGQGLKVLRVTAAVSKWSTTTCSETRIHGHHQAVIAPFLPDAASASSLTCTSEPLVHWFDIELQSGASAVEQVQSPSSKRWETKPCGVWLTLRLQVELGSTGTQVLWISGWESSRKWNVINCIYCCTALRHQSESSFSLDPQIWLWFYQQTCLLVAAGKQYLELVLLGSRHSGGSPSRPSHRWCLTHSQLSSPRALAPHSHNTDPWSNRPGFTPRNIYFSDFWQLRCSVFLLPQGNLGWVRFRRLRLTWI